MKLRIAIATALVALLAAPGLARAQGSPYPPGPFAPWDGSNPFNCELQDVGVGIDFPDPGADPFCVEFDKTQQNITDLGILEFLLNEPARVAAAGLKCFYYQHDHWRASIVQGEEPELWNWDGSYFFDKARAVGGVNLANFRILGLRASPSDYGQVPAELAPYFDQGGGGAYLIADIPADPSCVAKVDTPEEAAQVYGPGGPPPVPGIDPAPATTGPAAEATKPKKAKRCRKKKRTGGLEARSAKSKKPKRRCGKKRR